MIATLTLNYKLTRDASFDRCASFVFDTENLSDKVVSFDGLSVSFSFEKVKLTEDKFPGNLISPFRVKFTPSKDIYPDEILISSKFADKDEDSNIFRSGNITNGFVGNDPIKTADKVHLYARELTMIENHTNNTKFNIAFCSCDRLFTFFSLDEGNIIARFELEGKLVKKNVTFATELIALDDSLKAIMFFESYASFIGDYYKIKSFKPRQKGWSSWSCVYGDVNEKIVLDASENMEKYTQKLGCDLIQVDDGWQLRDNSSFDAYWVNHPEVFPSGQEKTSKAVTDRGQRYGLWYAPGLLGEHSKKFSDYYHMLNKIDESKFDGTPDLSNIKKSFGGGDGTDDTPGDPAIFGMDLSKKEVVDWTAEIFKRGCEEYGSSYFKIDFIINLIMRISDSSPISFPGDKYAVELYKEWTRKIRETVGDRFLLACGAPIGESFGIFDGMRASPDITWGGAGEPFHPGYYFIFRGDIQNLLLRAPYHHRTIINDPDALLVRGEQTEHAKDDCHLTFDEAKMWASTVLMCGGHILLNEEFEKLTADRQELALKTYELANYLKEKGCDEYAQKPYSFFEYPYVTEAFLAYDKTCKKDPNELALIVENDGKLDDDIGLFVTLYNYDDEEKTKLCDLKKYYKSKTEFVVRNLWNGETLSSVNGELNVNIGAHGAEIFEIN